MHTINEAINYRYDKRLRDSFWAFRSRKDLSVAKLVFRNIFDLHFHPGTSLDHLNLTINWLCAAQDATGTGGVSAFYNIHTGNWGPAYPETTGYIIPTFFSYADFSGENIYIDRAKRMAEWLLTIQLENGAFPIGPLWPHWDRVPIVFDTGQVIHGLVHTYKRTNDQRYLDAAVRAGDWLVEIIESDGSWKKHTALNIAHTYNVRTSWALLLLSEVSNQGNYCDAAVRNLDWSLSQQDSDGWFRNAAFRSDEAPLTHTIAYTIEGLLESGRFLGDQRLLDAARIAADVLKKKQEADGYLRARYDYGWQSASTWSCLTGIAQMAAIWFEFYKMTNDEGYFNAGLNANLYLKKRQPRNYKSPGITGGISGSYPIYAEYEPYQNLNWAAKFFADSLLSELRLITN